MMFLLPGSPCMYYGTEVGMEGAGDPDCRRPMLWNETLQDKELLNFFKNLVKFRKEFLYIINYPVLDYKQGKGYNEWDFSAGGRHLRAVYTGNKAVRGYKVPGDCVIAPEPDLKKFETGNLPADTLVVYYYET